MDPRIWSIHFGCIFVGGPKFDLAPLESSETLYIARSTLSVKHIFRVDREAILEIVLFCVKDAPLITPLGLPISHSEYCELNKHNYIQAGFFKRQPIPKTFRNIRSEDQARRSWNERESSGSCSDKYARDIIFSRNISNIRSENLKHQYRLQSFYWRTEI